MKMKMKINKDIDNKDKIIIYVNAAMKILRGIIYKPFLARSEGLLFIGKHVSISHSKHIHCGKNVKFEDYSEIHGLCSDGLYFGNNVTIGRGVMIRPSSYYGVGELGYGIRIGNYSSIGPHGYIGCSGKIVIGSNVMLGPKCSLFAENHNFGSQDKPIKEQGVNQKGIVIEDDCWLGSNVVVLDGVHIGRGCVIGAGTLVTRDIPPETVIYDKRNKIYRMREV